MPAQVLLSFRKVFLCSVVVLAWLVGGVVVVSEAAAQGQQAFVCEVPAAGAASVRAAFDEYYACTEPILDEWLSKYPAEVAQLQELYAAWQGGRSQDLRGQAEAARWVRKYPVDFKERSVELSAAQVMALAATQSAEPVQVAGAFERMFVDRDHRRLFLTSEEEGLVSVSIAERYAFRLEGKVGQSGARDFFIYDKNTALVEESNPKGGNRDLVVLDISDRAKPREVSRLRGALPEVGGRTYFDHSLMDSPPTFDQYLAMREGRMHTSCGVAPTVSTHAGVHCRQDGSCYKQEHRTNADEGMCTRLVVEARPTPTPRPRPRLRPRVAMPDRMDDFSADRAEAPMSTSSRETKSSPPPAPRAVRERSAAVTESGAAPQGGAGGAGSLSQMMVYGTNLYVLSASSGHSKGWLTTFDLSRPKQPRIRQVIALDNGPEALQRHDNLLLIAGRDAVVTASLGVETRPRLLGEFRQDCPVNYDPIVVQGGIGYRTIIVEGRRINCTSRLEVIDLSQPHQPVLRVTHPIYQPRGLAVLGERLFVADEHSGVVVFDITDRVSPVVVGTWGMPGVKDLVLSDFDLYAMSKDEVQTFYVGPLYERGVKVKDVWQRVEGVRTVVRTGRAGGAAVLNRR